LRRHVQHRLACGDELLRQQRAQPARSLDRPHPRLIPCSKLQQSFALMTIRTHTKLLEQHLALVEDRGEMRTLVRIDPDREHHQPPKCDGYVTPRRAS